MSPMKCEVHGDGVPNAQTGGREMALVQINPAIRALVGEGM